MLLEEFASDAPVERGSKSKATLSWWLSRHLSLEAQDVFSHVQSILSQSVDIPSKWGVNDQI